ncbi:MAG: thioredoxin family protein [Cytophagia bacterium]|nr:thioredoxin family protein [Cytophagia bacterium]
MKIILSFLFVSLFTGTWLTNFEEAQTQAKQEQKLILLNFSGSDWCAPCIKMKQEVFESADFIQLADESLVLVRADFPRSKKKQLPADQTAHNEKLAERYNPQGKFPYTLLLNSDGSILKTWDGYVFASQDKVLDELRKVIKP